VKWDENRLKKQNPTSHVGSTPFPTSEALKLQSASQGVHIEEGASASHGVHITSLTTTGASQRKAPTSSPPPSDGSLKEKSTVGLLGEKNNVVKI
jgi:hypothetical protein